MRRTLSIAATTVACVLGAAAPSAPAQAPDTTPPDTTITSGPAEGEVINSDSPMFAWGSSEPNSTFACVVDGIPLASCELAFVTGASGGPHTFSVAATDPAGNTDPTPATRNFTVHLEGGSLPELSHCPLDGNVIVATNAADTRTGTAGTDLMYGYGGNDVLHGAAGADCVAGQSGNDRLFGDSGGDFVFGGSGDDRIAGQGGNDAVYGEAGNDRVTGGAGNDTVDGGPGRDQLSDSSGRDTFAGGAGNDSIDARDTSGAGRRIADRVSCGSGRYDVAIVDAVDRVARDCERVRRR
jgi:Ca2+-binding RTX toxin-like protein